MNLDLNELRKNAGLSVEKLADETGVSYLDMAKILCKSTKCPYRIKERLKNFFLDFYTERIENIFKEAENK